MVAYEIRIGFAEGVWMVGVIDEICMPATETNMNPKLIDTKTRVQGTLPAEPQRRNGRYASMMNFLVMHLNKISTFIDTLLQASINVLQVYVGQFSCRQVPLQRILQIFCLEPTFYVI